MTDPSTQRSPIALFRNPEFLALASVRFVSGMAFATIIIALALYADLFEASGIAAGLFGSVYAIVRLVLVLPLGRKIDLGNSKRYLLLGLFLNVLLFLGLMLVESLVHVIFLRGFQAIGAVILWITGVAVVGEISPDDSRGLWIGTYNQARSIASLGGDLVGGALLFVYGFTTTYAVLIGLTLIATAMVYVFLRDDPGTRADPDEATGVETLIRLLKRRAVLALVMFRFSFSFGKMAVVLFLPIYARTQFGMNAFLIGGILAGGKLTKGLTQGYVGELSDRVGSEEWFIVAGTASYALGTALIPGAVFASMVLEPVVLAGIGQEITLVPGFFFLFVAYGILGIADSLRIPPSMALFVEEGEYFDSVAGSLSLRSVSWQVGAIIGPVVVGAMFDHVSYFGGFWLAAGLVVVAGVVLIALYEPEAAPDATTAPAVDD
ncbi:MAG: MFS transporter [Haloarcula sp.]